MSLRVLTTRQFERDVKHAKKRNKDLDKLWPMVELLVERKSLPARCRQHKLSGNWDNAWECHIESDWLLLWRETVDDLVLVRTGSHTDLFE